MRDMLDTLALSPAGNKLLLADCCREDPNTARGGLRGRAFGSALRLDQLPKNCAALFACSEGEQAFEHADWQHGAFTKALLTSLGTGQRVTANGLSESVYDLVEELVGPKGESQHVNCLLAEDELISNCASTLGTTRTRHLRATSTTNPIKFGSVIHAAKTNAVVRAR